MAWTYISASCCESIYQVPIATSNNHAHTIAHDDHDEDDDDRDK